MAGILRLLAVEWDIAALVGPDHFVERLLLLEIEQRRRIVQDDLKARVALDRDRGGVDVDAKRLADDGFAALPHGRAEAAH